MSEVLRITNFFFSAPQALVPHPEPRSGGSGVFLPGPLTPLLPSGPPSTSFTLVCGLDCPSCLLEAFCISGTQRSSPAWGPTLPVSWSPPLLGRPLPSLGLQVLPTTCQPTAKGQQHAPAWPVDLEHTQGGEEGARSPLSSCPQHQMPPKHIQ